MNFFNNVKTVSWKIVEFHPQIYLNLFADFTHNISSVPFIFTVRIHFFILLPVEDPRSTGLKKSNVI